MFLNGGLTDDARVDFLTPAVHSVLLKLIYPKYYKYWLYTLAASIDCKCLAYFDPKKVSFTVKIGSFLTFMLIN